MECNVDTDLLKRLDKAVVRSKEITSIASKLQSAFYTNDEQSIEDYLELLRTYSIYALGELDSTVQELIDALQSADSKVVHISDYQ
tara:strand:- start:1261 stop:1518 length:258 start_codon:yes stop_codon:yes gene_type:complete